MRVHSVCRIHMWLVSIVVNSTGSNRFDKSMEKKQTIFSSHASNEQLFAPFLYQQIEESYCQLWNKESKTDFAFKQRKCERQHVLNIKLRLIFGIHIKGNE